MRQLLVEVPRGHGERVLRIAGRRRGANLTRLEGEGADGPVDLAVVHVPNYEVEGLLDDLREVPDLRATLLPQGIISIQPPAGSPPEGAVDIEPRSPFEVFYSGLQSLGSWKGFLGYAAAAGVVVWTGLYTNTVVVLVAAMLIAPFAGPAMSVALGSARGDGKMILRGLLRYVAGLAVTIAVCLLLSLLLRQEIASAQMVDASQVSSVALLLPLAAGAAGALNLVQSERNSLVSGTAVGVLVAASLAPPAGLVGMASAIGEWGMVRSAAFLLGLQLLAINLSGSIVFRLYGLSARGARYDRGRAWLFPASVAVTLLALAPLLGWQFSTAPELQRSTRAQRAAAEIKTAIDASGLAEVIEANVRFTRADIPGQESLLAVLYVQARPGVPLAAAELEERVTRLAQSRLLEGGFNVTALVSVNVLHPPE